MKNFYYRNAQGGQIGPFTHLQLKQRRITPDTMIWHQGLPGWKPARQIPELDWLYDPTGAPVLANAGFDTLDAEIPEFGYSPQLVKVVTGVVLMWFLSSTSNSLGNWLAPEYYAPPLVYIPILFNLAFAFVPLVLSLSLPKSNNRTLALIASVVVMLISLYGTYYWAIGVL